MNHNDKAEKDFPQWLRWGMRELTFLDEREARHECEEIFTSLLGVSRAELYLSSPEDPHFFPRFSHYIQARKNRIPLAYLLKKAYFWEDEWEVGEGVFIPRPETETLVEGFLNSSGFFQSSAFHFLDLGTGTGIIAGTIAKLFPHSRGIASDISQKALTVAGNNAERLGVIQQLQLVKQDGMAGFEAGSFNVILSNPPYVPSFEKLEPEVLQEPKEALDGGEDGVNFYRRIFENLSCLKSGGSLWLEVGWDQSNLIQSFFKANHFKRIEIFKDLNGINRVVAGMDWNG